MQFPSSRYVSGAAPAAGGKGVIKGSLEISPMVGTRPSTPAMPGVLSQPPGGGGGVGKRGRRDGDAGRGFWCRLRWQKGHDILLKGCF